jgi:hypothetical protein
VVANMGLFNSNKDTKTPEYSWSKIVLETYEDNAKKIVDFGCTIQLGKIIILTNDDKIVLISKKYGETNTVREIEIKDIMKVELNIVTKNKTKQNLFTVVPTFETVKTIDYIELKIVTFDRISRFYLENLGSQVIDYADDLEVIFTYLEKKIQDNKF